MDINTAFRAELIASAIQANCAAHLDGKLSRKAWSSKQDKLWSMAAKKHVAAQVMRLVAPSLGSRR